MISSMLILHRRSARLPEPTEPKQQWPLYAPGRLHLKLGLHSIPFHSTHTHLRSGETNRHFSSSTPLRLPFFFLLCLSSSVRRLGRRHVRSRQKARKGGRFLVVAARGGPIPAEEGEGCIFMAICAAISGAPVRQQSSGELLLEN